MDEVPMGIGLVADRCLKRGQLYSHLDRQRFLRRPLSNSFLFYNKGSWLGNQIDAGNHGIRFASLANKGSWLLGLAFVGMHLKAQQDNLLGSSSSTPQERFWHCFFGRTWPISTKFSAITKKDGSLKALPLSQPGWKATPAALAAVKIKSMY